MLSKYQYTKYDETIVTDIFKRLYFSDAVKKSTLVENYFVKEKDSPESLSDILYSDPKYSTYILMLNDIKNLYEDWPMSFSIFNDYIDKKYSTSSIVINPNQILNLNFKNVTHIGNNTGLKLKIKSYDKQLCKFITEIKITQNIKNQLINNIFLYNNNTILKEILQNNTRIILDDKFSINYFKKNNNIVDPYSFVKNSNISYLTLYSQDPDGNFDVNVITNYSYELEKNDFKRNILLMRPEIISNLDVEIRKIFKNIKNNNNILELPNFIESSLLE